MNVLVTGGAGYLGSLVVRQLGEVGYDTVVHDNLSTGYEWAVLHSELVVDDHAELVASAQRIRDVLGWQPQKNDLSHIVISAPAWERRLAPEPRVA